MKKKISDVCNYWKHVTLILDIWNRRVDYQSCQIMLVVNVIFLKENYTTFTIVFKLDVNNVFMFSVCSINIFLSLYARKIVTILIKQFNQFRKW